MELFYTALWLFFCGSLLGWLGETAAAALKERKYVDRSLLFGPVCVVYGLSGVIISLALRDLAQGWVSLFLGSAIYATVIEWLAGHALERLTGVRWWDYSGRKWNLDGYICLSSSVLWGLLGVAAVKWFVPFALGLRALVPPVLDRTVLLVGLGVFLVDCLATALTLAGVVHRLPRVEEMGNRLAALSVRMGAWILRRTEGRIRRAHPKVDFRREKPREAPTVFAAGCGFYKLFWIFFLGALVGDLVETVFCRFSIGFWMSRSSVVWGPFSLVWGLAAALASLLLYRYRDRSIGNLFIAGALLGGAYEYFCSVFTELVFGVVFWEYDHIPYNLAGRVNLKFCLYWGVAAVVWIKVIYPRLSALIEKIPVKPGRILTWALTAFMVVDVAVSAMALGRYDARAHDIPARNAVEELLDRRFDDERMERIYPMARRKD